MKFIVTGGSGLLGTALKKYLPDNTIYTTRHELTLEHLGNIMEPDDCVIHCAAMVGGVNFNAANNTGIFNTNREIDRNVIDAAYFARVKNFIGILSTCVYGEQTPQPLEYQDVDLCNPHKTNYGYAYAKRLLNYQIQNIRNITGNNWFSLIPCNMYGINDNFNIENGHVIPALIHKAFIAARDNTDFVVNGNGKSLRQFVFADDIALIISHLWNRWKSESLTPIPTDEYSIEEVATLIAKKFDLVGRLEFDLSAENGIHRKTAESDLPKLKFTDIETGLNKTIDWFASNYPNIRK